MTRIEGHNPLATSRTSAGAAASSVDGANSRDKAGNAGEVAGPQDQVSLSNRGKVVAEAAQAVRSSSDIRQEKVLALKAAIANGTYAPDPRELAQRLLGSLQA
jgi:negative regulator of flagellin synthesis FlgM